MTFLKGRKSRKDYMLSAIKTTTSTKNKPSPILFGLIAATVVSIGFIASLAILAPQQLAEAAVTAADLVCNGCVGTSDIANNAVTSAKIGSGQVGGIDIANDAVTTAKISDTDGVKSSDVVNGEVKSEDIADGTITSTDIAPGTIPSDNSGTPDDNSVTSAKIADGEVMSADIGDGQVNTEDLASGAVKLNVHTVNGNGVKISPGFTTFDVAFCPSGETAIGGGFIVDSKEIRILNSWRGLSGDNTWRVDGFNDGTSDVHLTAHAICLASSP